MLVSQWRGFPRLWVYKAPGKRLQKKSERKWILQKEGLDWTNLAQGPMEYSCVQVINLRGFWTMARCWRVEWPDRRFWNLSSLLSCQCAQIHTASIDICHLYLLHSHSPLKQLLCFYIVSTEMLSSLKANRRRRNMWKLNVITVMY